jgi:ATPase subunit of ABC transporter with duplicated ATPase domains
VKVQLDDVAKHHGASTIIERVSLTVGPRSRLGVVGPNGVGKTTLLRLIAGLEQPDAGSITRSPPQLAVGYVPQQREFVQGQSVRDALRSQTGVAAAEHALRIAAAAVAGGAPSAADDYDGALRRFLALGGGDLEQRAAALLADLGLSAPLDQDASTLSGGERARVALAGVLLSLFDVLCLDEPTNDLDFTGLERLERFVADYRGALVVVTHDRAFLDSTVTRIVEIDPGSRLVREWAGGWSEYAAAKETERSAAYAAYDQALERRRELTELVSRRRTEARARGASLGKETGGADRRATRALTTKVHQARRQLERTPIPDKPFEPWQLQLELDVDAPSSGLVLRLEDAIAERGAFRLGPIDIDVAPGERLAVTGANGSGKSTLLDLLLGELPLTSGRRQVGRRTQLGAISPGREAYVGTAALLARFCERAVLAPTEARTLLAKFGLGADDVSRACDTLSPGERTRANLAELQSRRVNVLCLDEPTNHLDLEAVEQLEQALAGYRGSVVVVSHDRRFLEALAPERELRLHRVRPEV